MERQPLTDRQQEILTYMEHFTDEAGYPPTVREICKATGLKSPRSVSQHLQALERKGYIARGKDKSRAIRFLHRRVGSVVNLPLVDTESGENGSAKVSVDSGLFDGGDSFVMKAEGENMKAGDIMEGDLIVVNPASEASDGDVVVAKVNDVTTVKRFEARNGGRYLVPENASNRPIEVSPTNGNVRIVGKVVGLIRKMS